MQFSKSLVITLSSFGLLLAYNNVTQARNLDYSSSSSQLGISTQIIANSNKDNTGKANGGQVVESGAYHLEFVPGKDANGTHLDLYLQKGDTHEAIPNAKVTAQVQSPDGKQKSLNLSYDSAGKHYTALLPGKATGQYQVKITADVSGQKVNGRFSFKQ